MESVMINVATHFDLRSIGEGAPESHLSFAQMRSIVEQALLPILPGSRVLAIISDKTRDDNTPELLPVAAELLAARGVEAFDALVAQGTHGKMTASEKDAKVGARDGVRPHGLGRIFDHSWDDADELVALGELTAERVRSLTGGLLHGSVPVRLNRLLAPGVYDTVLVFGATVPHEVAGFAGGAKYFFPGVAGAELTHATHWLGALSGIENTIGKIETPVRALIEAASDFVSAQVISLNSVVTRGNDDTLRTHALFAGDIRESFRRAAEVSRQVHIKYTNRIYRRVVALLDEHYDDLWVGGKASYKLGGIIEPGGELLIYAPHLACVSETHGAVIERHGYQPLERVRELVASSGELQTNLCVAAHLTHVAYAGRTDERGRTVPRYRITLASQLDEATCARLNLGYADYRTFSLADFTSDDDTLVVERAGRDLYLVKPV